MEPRIAFAISKLKARLRGETRIAERGERGRGFAPRVAPKITMSARIYRAETGEWETVDGNSIHVSR